MKTCRISTNGIFYAGALAPVVNFIAFIAQKILPV